MSNLTFSQIEQLWTSNGGDPKWAPTMAGISVEENHQGDPSVINNNPGTGDYSVGLWQINYFGSLLQSRSARYGTPATLQADPNAQARAAIDLLGNSPAGLSNWQADAVARAAQQAGGPLTPTQVTEILGGQQLKGGTSGATGIPVTASAVGGLEPFEGPRYLGLLTPTRCVFGQFGGLPLVGGGFCIVDAAAARKIKGYTVMAIGGFGLVLGLALVMAIGLKSSGAAKVASSAGKRIPGPIGVASRGASSGVRREPAGYRAGNRSNPIRFEGRGQMTGADRQELEQRRAEDDRRRARQASDARERAEGFDAQPARRRPDLRRGRAA